MSDTTQDRIDAAIDRFKDDDYTHSMLRQVKFGLTVEDFMGSPIGRYLTARSEAERAALLETLADVDPADSKTIAATQTRIQVCEAWRAWLAEAITEAAAARQKIGEMDAPATD